MSKVSVITVSYNAEKAIEETVKNVLDQTYKNLEYIIIDGKSTDGTLSILSKYKDRFAYFISEPDNGIYDAMNKGIDVATGDWIIFMNAGDLFANNEVLKNIFEGENYDEYGAVVGDTITLFDWGKMISKGKAFTEATTSIPFCHQSAFARSSLMKQYHFDTSYKIVADYNFFRKIYLAGHRFCPIGEIISIYEGRGVSANNVIKLTREYCRANGIVGWRYYLKMLEAYIRRIIPDIVFEYVRKVRFKDRVLK